MESIYNWSYLKSNVTVQSVAKTFVHIIDFKFFRTIGYLFRSPSKIRNYLLGEKDLQSAFSFYLSSLIFVYLVTFINVKLFPDSFTPIEDSSLDDYMQYIITVPFIVVIAFLNMMLFRKERLNYLSNLIIAFYIIGQSMIYLTVYFTFIAIVDVFDEPKTQALIYVLIIFGNLFLFNLGTFKRNIFSTFWRATVATTVAFIIMLFVASFI